ncbi:MAG TPA: retroviral-like aspartic protease family protein [Planktothrix sp.]|jgi:clan AA aspartic protease (TIGR02281 family)
MEHERHAKFRWKTRAGAGLATLIALSSSYLPVFADAYMDQGIAYYKKRDFNHALAAFAQAYRANPSNGTAVYYEGVCKQYMGDNKAAASLYASVIANFSGTQAAVGAMAALSRIDPEYANQLMRRAGGGSSSSSSQATTASATATTAGGKTTIYIPATDTRTLPDFCRVPFRRDPSRVGGNMLLLEDCSVNGRRTEMLFDTGAELVVFGKNQLSEMGLPMPQGAPVGHTQGVGSTEGIPVWMMKCTIKVGSIERPNFPITIQDNMGMFPLLGQTFFRDFEYTIDYTTGGKDHGTITFVKRGASVASARQDNYSVPFKREGNNMVVDVEIGGRTVPMYFDTGAANICFTYPQAKAAGISIPEDARPVSMGGVGGSTPGVVFAGPRIRLGPIEKSNVEISVIESAAMAHPLLGQTYFGDWQYTIDNQNNVIHFVRR